jgi:alkanesulfonate monooxygenase SsuD/methylene tetrahydromethanopterin reductase-like flavin-dependent oxidoreductase (luciferase family)
VLLLPLYHPVVLAKQLADLDSRSGGRVTVGVGVGGEFRAEFDAVGVPVTERGARTSESIEVLRKLWRGGPVSHEGTFYRFPEVELRPVRAPGAAATVTRPANDVTQFLGAAYGDKPPEMLDKIAPSGTPDEVAARLQPYVDAGARHIIISPAAHRDTLEIVALAAREVLPRLVTR